MCSGSGYHQASVGRYDDGELLTLITLAKEITQSCFIRNLPQGKQRREQVGQGYTVQLRSAVKLEKVMLTISNGI